MVLAVLAVLAVVAAVVRVRGQAEQPLGPNVLLLPVHKTSQASSNQVNHQDLSHQDLSHRDLVNRRQEAFHTLRLLAHSAGNPLLAARYLLVVALVDNPQLNHHQVQRVASPLFPFALPPQHHHPLETFHNLRLLAHSAGNPLLAARYLLVVALVDNPQLNHHQVHQVAGPLLPFAVPPQHNHPLGTSLVLPQVVRWAARCQPLSLQL